MNSLCENAVSGDYSAEGLIPKKVHFRDKDESVNMDLLADHVGQPTASWKENLLGSSSNIGGEDLEVKEDFELLGCNIGFLILQNRIYSLWKPSLTINLMDIENGFFLAKFVNKIDHEKTVSFDRTQTFLSMVMSWIRFSGLPGYMYKHKILVEIGGLVGKVTKLDMNMDNKVRGRFARMDVYVTLDRPLVSQVLINGKIQRVEYEFLLKLFPLWKVVVSMTVEETSENGGSYGPWMHVEERALSEMEKIVGMDARDKYEYPYNYKNKGREILPRVNLGIEISHCNVSRLDNRTQSLLDNRAQNRGPLNELGFKNLGLGESNLALGIKLGQRNGSPNGLVVSTNPLLQDWGVEEFGKKSFGSSNSGYDLLNDGVDINLEPFSHPSLLSKEPVDVTKPVETVDDLNPYRHT
ncbi:hypothetical protein Golob_002246 [Gossypium lobatum]|uniref:DUF4283 domain-containing protein n=1 Tax=Gossypium lobatum TaxID=34289 RepID=A0A7J8N4E3_9ROSI|nr:hypothetical protein [Gossypium lobatum]